MFALRIGLLIFVCAVGQLAVVFPLAAEESAAPAPNFSPEEQKSRQAILSSADWTEAFGKFDNWLSVQTTYNAAEVAKMKRELAAQIEVMPAKEMPAFLYQMQRRLDVLLSPEVSAVRAWADGLYTAKGKQKLLEEYHITDPISMSAEQLSAALEQFALDRQSEGAAQAAFQKAQTTQSEAVIRNEQQQASAARAAPKQASSFPTPSIPNRNARPQQYEAPYNPVRYTIGPWGGVWVGH